MSTIFYNERDVVEVKWCYFFDPGRDFVAHFKYNILYFIYSVHNNKSKCT